MKYYPNAVKPRHFSAGLVACLCAGGLLLSVAAHAESPLEEKLKAQIAEENGEVAQATAQQKADAAREKATREAAAAKASADRKAEKDAIRAEDTRKTNVAAEQQRCKKKGGDWTHGKCVMPPSPKPEPKPMTEPPAANEKTERESCINDDNIHKAAARGNIKFVRSCLQAGVDVNIREGNQWTPLHSAARHGHLDIVKLLILEGANINAADVTRRTPLDEAIIDEHQNVINYLSSIGATKRD